MTGGHLTSKTFKTFSEAMLFSVYKAGFEAVHSIDKVD